MVGYGLFERWLSVLWPDLSNKPDCNMVRTPVTGQRTILKYGYPACLAAKTSCANRLRLFILVEGRGSVRFGR